MLGTRILIKTKKHYLCTHFLACAIAVNVVGTNAWYLLHLCGGCGAHVGHPLQLFYGLQQFLLWCSTFVPHALRIASIDCWALSAVRRWEGGGRGIGP